MVIDKVSLYRLRIPLKQPYKIATAEMKAFDLTIVAIQSDGREGLGEAMADVKGYFWENADGVWDFAREKGKRLLGMDLSKAHQTVSYFSQEQPCATTPFLTSMEMLSQGPALAPPLTPTLVPMVGILQATDRDGIQKEIKTFIRSGYTIIKVKVGFDPDQDLLRVRLAQESLEANTLIRLDANQGYRFQEAKRLVENLDPYGIEFLEQPFPEDEWEAMVELSKISPIPLGLDESIYGMPSVEKALRLKCARFVKFKLMKIGSAALLLEHIEKCRNLGLEVILGNGAAGEISAYHEALVASKATSRVGEMNGFLKQKEFILAETIKTQDGKILLQPHFNLKLDPAKLEKYLLDHLCFP